MSYSILKKNTKTTNLFWQYLNYLIDWLYLIIMVLFIYNIKTLVTHQVTNDHELSFLHKLNTSNVQTRLINVRTTQKRFHNAIGSWTISWRPVLVVAEDRVPGENHRPWASNW
jgi:hypothetical protein